MRCDLRELLSIVYFSSQLINFSSIKYFRRYRRDGELAILARQRNLSPFDFLLCGTLKKCGDQSFRFSLRDRDFSTFAFDFIIWGKIVVTLSIFEIIPLILITFFAPYRVS